MEILGIGIRQNDQIIGLKTGAEEVKGGQYADDLWAALHPPGENVKNTLQELEKFSKVSGLQINLEKITVMRVGSLQKTNAKYYSQKKLFWSEGAVKILGVIITLDKKESCQKNFVDVLEKVKSICSMWSTGSLTLSGKIMLINMLIVPLFIPKFMLLPSPPGCFFKLYKKIVLDIIWGQKPHRISYMKLLQNYDNLGLVDLEMKNKALKAAWPYRWRTKLTLNGCMFHYLYRTQECGSAT